MKNKESMQRHLYPDSLKKQVTHGRRVSSLAYEIGRELHMTEEECEHLAIAGFFHDIGKTELIEEHTGDDALLVEEMNSIRQHPQKGYDMLRRHGYDQDICEAVLYHHENCDGSGYPFKLESGQIPVGACILRVCDVFCALTENRQYRSLFSPEQALVLMAHEIRYYDMKIFLAFQRVLHSSGDGSLTVPEPREEVKRIWRKL